MSGNIKARETL
jgi:hypothetical protein